MIIKIDDEKLKAPEETRNMESLALAYLGDAVIEMLARDHTFSNYAGTHIGELHKKTVNYVSANAQSLALNKILPILTEEEEGVYKRGRNVKSHSVPKHTDPAVYHRSTGLEALFGFLYLTGQTERIQNLFNIGFLDNDKTEEI